MKRVSMMTDHYIQDQGTRDEAAGRHQHLLLNMHRHAAQVTRERAQIDYQADLECVQRARQEYILPNKEEKSEEK